MIARLTFGRKMANDLPDPSQERALTPVGYAFRIRTLALLAEIFEALNS